MLRYGKLARQAVSVISYLAERYQADAPSVSSSEIGRERKIPAALAAKLLSQASAAGLVLGTTGPGGGYRLAKHPGKIRLSDIVSLFGRAHQESLCPYSLDWCGNGEPCPLHEGFTRLRENSRAFLEETTLAVFLKPHAGPRATGGKSRTAKPTATAKQAPVKSPKSTATAKQAPVKPPKSTPTAKQAPVKGPKGKAR